MSERICKLVDNSGIYYAVYETVIDQFVSPAFHVVGAVLNKQGFNAEMMAAAENNVFTLTEEKLLCAANAIEKLRDGLLVTIDEALVLDNFYDFLCGTVAWKHYAHAAIDTSVLTGWIAELGLDQEFPGDDPYEVIDDGALYPAFQCIVLDRKYPGSSYDSGEVIPSPGQNKLAGRFLSAAATIAGVYPFGTLAPHEVLDKFYWLSQLWNHGDHIAHNPT